MRGPQDPLARIRCVVTLVLVAASTLIHTARVTGQETHCLHARIVDGEGRAVTARISIRGSDNEYCCPLPESLYIYRPPHFYADSSFTVTVPSGETRVKMLKGFQFVPVDRVVDVGSDTTVVFVLERWIDMRAEGWYSGDTHAHIAHQEGEGEDSGLGYALYPDDGYLVASGEGLNVVHYLDNDRFFTGAPDPVSTPECIVYFSEEYRSFAFGHLSLLGLDELIVPASTGPRPTWPMSGAILESLRTQTNVAASYCHPLSSNSILDGSLWPGGGMARDLPITALEGLVEAMDILCYTNYVNPLQAWYELLNSRIKIWGSAGTDAVVDRPFGAAPGGFRVFVNIGDSSLTYERWVTAFREGKSFFTSGPLFRHFEFGGASIGDSLIVDDGIPGWVDGEVSVASIFPAEIIEIVVNGNVAKTIIPPTGTPQMVDTTFSLWVEETSWVAARAKCDNRWGGFALGDSLIAHTNPIFVRFGEDELYADSEYWVEWLNTLETYLDWAGMWEDPAEEAWVYEKVAWAREYYLSVAHDPGSGTGAVADDPIGSPERLLDVYPNPFNPEVTIAYALPRNSRVTLKVYDALGRLEAVLLDGLEQAGVHSVRWDGRNDRRAPCRPGVYFCRLAADDRIETRKIVLLE